MKGSSNSICAVYIALGSNLQGPRRRLIEAIDAINRRFGPICAVSKFYLTSPLESENGAQPDYLNCAVSVQSTLPPRRILESLLEIEREMGRKRENETRWGPRVIDLDLLAAGDVCLDEPDFKLPHAELALRDFVLYPLRDIAPRFIHPLTQKNIDQMIYEYYASGLPSHIVGFSNPPLLVSTPLTPANYS